MSSLNLININKIYDNKVHAVYDFSLDIKDKEFVVFVGPSGCGKSTTLRMVAGLEEITSGELYIDGRLVNNIDASDRDIAMVFQNYALYPHMTVFDNMAFALKLRLSKMPVYEESEELTALETKKREITKIMLQAHGKWTAKKDDEVLKADFDKAFDDFKTVVKEVSDKAKQKIGKYEARISYLEKEIIKSKKEIERLNKLKAKPTSDEDKDILPRIENEIVMHNKEIEQYTKEIEHLSSNDVPLFVDRKMTKQEIVEKVFFSAEVLDLLPYLKRKPKALSGGQRQRVALGRAIVRNPKVFLMDEPLSNLDAKLRVQTRTEILRLTRSIGATTIYVTHDQTEAMTMADRIVVMKDGYIQQIDTPENIYKNPENTFVGGFIGNPAMNFINGSIEKGKFITGEFQLDLDKDKIELLKDYEDKEIILGVRPEHIYLENSREDGDFSKPFNLECEISELLGNDLIVYSKIADQRINIKVASKNKIQTGDINKYKIDLNLIHFFDKESGKRIK